MVSTSHIQTLLTCAKASIGYIYIRLGTWLRDLVPTSHTPPGKKCLWEGGVPDVGTRLCNFRNVPLTIVGNFVFLMALLSLIFPCLYLIACSIQYREGRLERSGHMRQTDDKRSSWRSENCAIQSNYRLFEFCCLIGSHNCSLVPTLGTKLTRLMLLQQEVEIASRPHPRGTEVWHYDSTWRVIII